MDATTLSHEILPPSLAIKAMRSSGYRDTAHALAELIDNSIQAGIDINQCTDVEVICIDRSNMLAERNRRQIDRIAVYDNASGMDADTLRMALQFGNGTHLSKGKQKGIGKFGMGLPNASISQCRKVEVWTWQNNITIYTALDLNDIESGRLRQVPEPTEATLPNDLLQLIRSPLKAHGTLILWSALDRVTWKGSKPFLTNAEFLVGRMYRYFIAEDRARIRLAAYEQVGLHFETHLDSHVRPNDPLYLMKGTSSPSPFDKTPAFDLVGEFPIEVMLNDESHAVWLRFSICSQLVRTEFGGNSELGKHAAKNQGVSVVRAQRELEMNKTFDNGYDPRDRWWGVEVSFEPELDDIFGVTNNKQAATSFYMMDLDADAKKEGLAPGAYKEILEASEDPRLPIYEICNQIRSNLRTIKTQVKRMTEGSRGTDTADPASVEAVATRAAKLREDKGYKGRTDEEVLSPPDVRTSELRDELISEGIPEEHAERIAVQYVKSGLRFLFQEAPIPGPAIFDVKSAAGTLIININARHPAREHLFELLRTGNGEEETPALRALKLLLTAWARMEDEAGDERRESLEDTRMDWGKLARDFLKEEAG